MLLFSDRLRTIVRDGTFIIGHETAAAAADKLLYFWLAAGFSSAVFTNLRCLLTAIHDTSPFLTLNAAAFTCRSYLQKIQG